MTETSSFPCSESETVTEIMDGNHSGNLPERIKQEIHSFTAWLAVVGFSFSNLLILVGLMYQGSGAALFDEHNAIMLGLIIDVVTFTTALAAWVLAASNRNSPLLFKSVCLILGALACDLLLFILNPILGWVIFALGASTLVYLLYGSYKQIFESYQENFQSISNWLEQKFPQIFESCRENLQPVLNWFKQKFQQIFESCQENIQSVSNWFKQKFNSQSISQTSSQASNGSLILTPNVTKKQAMKSEECLTEG